MLSRTQENYTKHSVVHDTVPTEDEAGSPPAVSNVGAVSWAAIFAGAAAAAGLSLILLFVGAGFGLASASPWVHAGAGAGALGVAAILWLSFTQLMASGLGGYLAGRLRSKWVRVHDHEVAFRDTAHGLITWAVASLASVALLGSLLAPMVERGTQAAATVASGTSIPLPGNASITHFTDSLFDSGAQAGAPIGPQPMDPLYRAEALRIFGDSLQQGHLSTDDSRYLGALVAQRTGLAQDQAEQRVDAAFVAAQARVTLSADKLRKDSAYSALWSAIALLIGAFAASLFATFGGRQRDLS
ncbi:MAG TPA: hypothetical protein VGM47_07515 [Gammaproteobacteria bacterium]